MLPLLAIVALASLSIDLPSDQQVSAFADTKLYEEVIDRLFQSDSSGSEAGDRLRYTYCDSGEMQVVIRHEEGGDLRMELWRLPKGSPTVWEQLAALWRTVPGITAQEAANRIAIPRESSSISRNSPMWKILEAGHDLRITLAGRDGVFTDGSQYDFAVSSLSKTLRLSLSGPQDSRKSGDPVVRWMGRVRAALDRTGE